MLQKIRNRMDYAKKPLLKKEAKVANNVDSNVRITGTQILYQYALINDGGTKISNPLTKCCPMTSNLSYFI